MVYSATIFTNGVTAKALNNLESQFAEAKVEIDLHGHPAIHYLKADSDAKFFPIAAGLDADKIDGFEATDLMGFQLDPGIIIMHKALANEFTNGYLNADPRWHQCDGSTINGIKSPDMRGFFPKCPTASNTTGTGGAATLTLAGSVAVGDHTLTLAEIPSHYHTIYDIYYTGYRALMDYGWTPKDITIDGSYTEVQRTTSYNHADADQPHNHGNKDVSFNAITLTPLAKAHYFLIKVTD
jgi:hypothetical protein